MHCQLHRGATGIKSRMAVYAIHKEGYEMQTKTELRATCKALRDAIPEAERMDKSGRLCRLLFDSEIYKAAQSVFCFVGFGSEIHTRFLLAHSLASGKRVAVPRTGKAGHMDFIAINSLEDMQISPFGVPEPSHGAIALPDAQTLMLLPGLAFGRDGFRVGYGRGFYDRYLSRVQTMKNVGICFAAQLLDAVPHDAYDIAADAILTEEGWVQI